MIRIRGGLLATLAAAGLLLAPVAPTALVAPGAMPSGLPLPALGVQSALAATPDLTLVTAARYVVQPDRRRIHVVVDLTATSHKADTVTRRFFFEGANLAVLPGTANFSIAPAPGSATKPASSRPTVRVRSANASYTVLALGFGRQLGFNQSVALRLQFDLPDAGGPSTRAVRVGPSLVSFPVWAFASDATPGSSVSVVFPAGFSARVETGSFPPPITATSGSTVFRTGPLTSPLAFYAYLSADQPATLVPGTITTSVGSTQVQLTLRRWAEDPAWASRVGDVFRRGLPLLGAAIGLPYPAGAPLSVEESSSRSTGGYAGMFAADTRTIQVAYYADPFVALHEAAHVWFNGGLLADRWADEAFASYYAAQVAGPLKLRVRVQALTPALRDVAIPLNAWGAVGGESPQVEDYGYAAAYRLATAVGARAGPAHLTAVWQAIAAGVAAYQPTNPDRPRETLAAGPADWRVLLDQLEAVCGTSFTDLWSTWVVRPEDAALLEARTAARQAYAGTLAAAGDWELSPTIRRALGAWQFEQAQSLLGEAQRVLQAREPLESAAASVGLTLPPSVRDDFESAAGPTVALAEIDAENTTIETIRAALAARAASGGTLASVGLFGAEPDHELAAARSAFAAGELVAAAQDAELARVAWSTADAVGQGRTVGAVALAAMLVGALVILRRIRARRRTEAWLRAAVVGADHYATLGEPSAGGPACGASDPASDGSGETSG